MAGQWRRRQDMKKGRHWDDKFLAARPTKLVDRHPRGDDDWSCTRWLVCLFRGCALASTRPLPRARPTRCTTGQPTSSRNRRYRGCTQFSPSLPRMYIVRTGVTATSIGFRRGFTRGPQNLHDRGRTGREAHQYVFFRACWLSAPGSWSRPLFRCWRKGPRLPLCPSTPFCSSLVSSNATLAGK